MKAKNLWKVALIDHKRLTLSNFYFSLLDFSFGRGNSACSHLFDKELLSLLN